MLHRKTSSMRSAAASLRGEAAAPGDKSVSHRALMLSSQAPGVTRISGLLEGEDVLNTAKALRSLGVTIRQGEVWETEGVGIGGLAESAEVLDMGNSGTSTRLLMGLVAPYPFTTFFTGDASLSKRPMKRVIEPLERMGAKITARRGHLPLAVTGAADMLPARYRLPVPSAQVKSAILLAGLNIAGKTTVIEPQATRDHTENMLRFLGFKVEVSTLSHREGDGGGRGERRPHPEGGGDVAISIHGHQRITPANHEIYVPGDPSSAAFPVVAALLCRDSRILIRNVCVNPLRAGLFTTLKEMGAKLECKNERMVGGEKVADITAETSALKGVVVPAERAPSMIDEYPILAVAAAFARGETAMHGLSELRVKESDRLAAIVESLAACGVSARAEGDSLYVKGGDVKGGATIATHFDHRIAMSFLVLGMASNDPVTVDDATAIATSFPNFVQLMNGLGAKIEMPDVGCQAPDRKASSGIHPLVIAVDGPAASGKGTLARRLAEHFGLDYLDTGSLYRAVGMKLVYAGKDPRDRAAATEAAQTIDADDLSNPRLRQEHIGQAASVVSAFPEVREALLEFQRNFARSANGAVLDGRDIGTVVCPEANFKFFVTATLYARARRRHKELSGQGIEVVFESVLDDLRERDERDGKRAIAPMKPAGDALVIDTTVLDAGEVFERACGVVEKSREAEKQHAC
ncbi:MAG: 3-phosphoshikimate 1-carboxyvinyltransferase [Pseudomonadota bacterium]|nr:3-phosphoshikimate 1-carboxyvinyltransferase [Pseudomonadota bacterium]MDE3037920.1 3-phosphoshikimate 1-carboxyvinyltransferase [Pseudomonadota bacterium]